jgi:hypothetical protein
LPNKSILHRLIDLDPQMVDFCREHLPTWHTGAFDDPRFWLVIEDGVKFARETKERFDVVIIDVNEIIKTSSMLGCLRASRAIAPSPPSMIRTRRGLGCVNIAGWTSASW